MSPGTERVLLVALQEGVELVPRPFAALGERFGLDEGAVVDLLVRTLADGRGRRFGGIFDNARLGARSALCAVDSGGDPTAVAAAVVPHAGVTHCYQRAGRPDLWFTLTALPGDYAATLAAIDAVRPVLELPTVRRFKLGVILAPVDEAVAAGADQAAAGVAAAATADTPVELDAAGRRLVDRLQGWLEVTARPFTGLGTAGDDEDAVLDRLRAWRAAGALRRVALICRHRRLGYHGNVMAVWDVPDGETVAAGRTLAREPSVSHCYERVRRPGWPWNLYAMIHRPDEEDARATAARLGRAIGDPPARVLATLREFKKTSPRPFAGDAG